VDWDTTAKTASFTAVSGNGYFINTTSGAITVTLPASPSAGDIVSLSDYAGTAATNNITIARNGSNIEGLAENAVINSTREARTYVYVDGTQGWIPVNTNDSTTIPPAYVTATGGTVTCCGDFKIHTFTGPGTFCVSCAGNAGGSNTVSYLVVAGGGGGGKGDGGGGGAGGFREGRASTCSYTVSPLNAPTGLPVTATAFPITVGAGGAGGPAPTVESPGDSGSNSIFSTITSTGGGFGGGNGGPSGGPGGSGGGGSAAVPGAGLGNTPPVSPPQGSDGGANEGGGGGATAAGASGSPGPNAGGAGGTTHIPGSPFTKSTGGEGDRPGGPSYPPAPANSGNGGGGICGGGAGPGPAGNGGSGIVVIRYKYQ
jgi:hypothetical protein